MNVKSNINKLLFYTITQRRNFIPILSIYFLTLENTMANQLGIIAGISYVISFFLEIPSGYISDNLGHKKTLMLSKTSMIISTLFYGFGNSLYLYFAGAIFQTISIAFDSGTNSALLNETLEDLKQEKKFNIINGKIKAKASLVSVVMILLLPLLTKISIVLPIQIYLPIDILGLFVISTLITPKSTKKITKENKVKLKTIIKKSYKAGFFPIAIFTGAIIGVSISVGTFRTVYLENLGLPIILMGLSMALSRIIWFLIGNNLKYFKNIKIKNIIRFEIFFFPIIFILMGLFSNPYIILIISAIGVGYMWGRISIYTGYILENFIFDKKYTATILSIKSQFSYIFNSIVSIIVGFIMGVSYKLGHIFSGIILFVILFITYFFIKYK